ncbi:TDP-N-acetylfucosamine:lipid II N-acetylfucosaminyltransferase [Mycoavidus sp. B2-EB]|uniref:TDP-N-acetylfucosamine:lipid II N-acetylfucosaminyltransferase n=1 Tax=Mycoavidus sp. B2-EB TaxID=2651972 RepID=UPI001627C0D7|nr:TDP-N-acetylfucosamine:lipid II N-acetylfucosaminyltransferase [Mycoavidus sp. B2-EB]BBO60033.1 TDP-N-acetylfucosamine:lipid II N-acetylfucosaminyltransferase [Mycoavidus sp. B2-EB]
MSVIHILGSEIEHHNRTVLNFFNQILAPKLLQSQMPLRFWVVAREPTSLGDYSALQVKVLPDRRTLAKAVAALAKECRAQHFFFHGQFNPGIWLLLLTGRIRPAQASWHIWGADLYEDATGFRSKLFYLLRRRVQGCFAHVFATRGDLAYYQQRYPRVPTSLLYFPTRMPEVKNLPRPRKPDTKLFTILLGNSGARSNRHIEALHTIHKQFGKQVRILVPLGYPLGNPLYINEIRVEAEKLFAPGQVELLNRMIDFNEYQKLLEQCDLGYFLFQRQQGVGTLCLLIQHGIPFVISRQNPFQQDLFEQRIPVLFYGDDLSREMVRETQHRLAQLDQTQIAFFSPNYITGWQRALAITDGKKDSL